MATSVCACVFVCVWQQHVNVCYTLLPESSHHFWSVSFFMGSEPKYQIVGQKSKDRHERTQRWHLFRKGIVRMFGLSLHWCLKGDATGLCVMCHDSLQIWKQSWPCSSRLCYRRGAVEDVTKEPKPPKHRPASSLFFSMSLLWQVYYNSIVFLIHLFYFYSTIVFIILSLNTLPYKECGLTWEGQL